jgi:hypothetical protein
MSNDKVIQVVKKLLDPLIGKPFIYGGREQTIQSYQIIEEKDRVNITTDVGYYEKKFEAVSAFVNQLEEVSEKNKGVQVISRAPIELPGMQVNSTVISKLKDELMENIKKVKQNKDYIPQAMAVKENVDGFIELAKIELAYINAYINANKK